ncbi:MAG TPA: farnesyl diphosphate synthase [Vicinamibacterales bacterium]
MPAGSDFPAYLDDLRRLIDDGLTRALPDGVAPAVIVGAMRYPLAGGGKRLRPCLTLAVADALAPRGPLELEQARHLALPFACAIELVHTYSLVHDDLPAMDNDTLRRGRPTTHVVYGDGLAVLAGDGLLTEAFALASRVPSPVVPAGAPGLPADRRLRGVHTLAAAAGAVGMVGGQAIDLVAAGRVSGASPAPLDSNALEDMHARKTGALIRAAATLGAVAVGADDAVIQAIDDYARDLGLAFQIVDDVLDVEGSAAALGKTAGKDAAAGKPTYPALFGVEASRRMATICVARAEATLKIAGIGGRLTELARWSLGRRS